MLSQMCDVISPLALSLSLFVMFNGDNSPKCPFALVQAETLYIFQIAFLGDGFDSVIWEVWSATSVGKGLAVVEYFV